MSGAERKSVEKMEHSCLEIMEASSEGSLHCLWALALLVGWTLRWVSSWG